MNKTKTRQQQGSQELIQCDFCGRRKNPSEITWTEDEGSWICHACRAEEESCGCSDE